MRVYRDVHRRIAECAADLRRQFDQEQRQRRGYRPGDALRGRVPMVTSTWFGVIFVLLMQPQGQPLLYRPDNNRRYRVWRELPL